MYRVNAHNRLYPNGIECEESLKQLIVSELNTRGANSSTGFIPRAVVTNVALHCRVARATVRKVWKQYLQYSTCDIQSPRGRSVGSGRKLDTADEEFICYLVNRQPSIFKKELRAQLYELSNNVDPHVNPVSVSTIERTVRHRLPEGTYSRKKLQRINCNRWTERNIIYSRDFFNHMGTLNPYHILFYDESSFCTGNSHRYYGSAPVGQRAVEVFKNFGGESYTLFLLCGLNGKVFAKVTEGISTTETFIEFMLEAIQAYGDDGELIIQPSYTVCGDNAKIHRYRGEDLLHEFLDPLNVDIVYLPVFSPSENPTEFAFSFIKGILKHEPLSSMLQAHVPTGVLEAVNLISHENMYSFYKAVSFNYMNL